MCQPKSKGGRRCAAHASESLHKAMNVKNRYVAEKQRLSQIPKDKLSNDERNRLSTLDQRISEAESRLKEKRLDWYGTSTGRKDLQGKIRAAEASKDEDRANRLRQYAEAIVAREERIFQRNIQEYGEETQKKELKANYLPKVYSQYAGATSSAVPEYPTPGDVEKERQRLEADPTVSSEEAKKRLDLMERSQKFYAKWTERNFGKERVAMKDAITASTARDIAIAEHGEGSPQALAATRHANLTQEVVDYRNKRKREITDAYYSSERNKRELERQQEAIHNGVILHDAKFRNDFERQTSPHGVTRQDLGKAGMITEKAKAAYGKDSEQYKIAVKRQERVQQAWQTRRAVISHSRRMEVLETVREAREDVLDHVEDMRDAVDKLLPL